MHLADVITLNEIEELKNKIGNVQSNVSSIKNIVEITADNVEVIKANSYVEGKLNCNRVHGEALFNTAGTHTWTAPEGVTRVDCLIIGSSGGGGGGGGGGCGGAVYYDDYTSGGGGGGGSSGGVGASGNLWRGFIDITPNRQYSVVVGAGGAGGAAGSAPADSYTYANTTGKYVNGNGSTYGIVVTGSAGGNGKNGGNGGDSKFGDFVVVAGGKGGLGGKGGAGGKGGGRNYMVVDSCGSGGEAVGTPGSTGTSYPNISYNEIKLDKQANGKGGNAGNSGNAYGYNKGYSSSSWTYWGPFGTGGAAPTTYSAKLRTDCPVGGLGGKGGDGGVGVDYMCINTSNNSENVKPSSYTQATYYKNYTGRGKAGAAGAAGASGYIKIIW